MRALSIVVPCFNEEACLGVLHERLTSAAQSAVGDDYEIVLVNDGSRDTSWTIMRDLAAGDPRILAINLSRNHGHQLALTAGLDLCSGETILIIDADLQDPPELLPAMLETMRTEHADVVYGVQSRRKGSLGERMAGAMFYGSLNLMLQFPIPRNVMTARLPPRLEGVSRL